MFVYDMAPAGVGRCAERIHLYALPGEVSDATTTFEHYLARELNAEDIELVEAVQRGVASRGYRPGRLMVDPGASAGWGEQFVHHFNTLVLEALERAGLIEP